MRHPENTQLDRLHSQRIHSEMSYSNDQNNGLSNPERRYQEVFPEKRHQDIFHPEIRHQEMSHPENTRQDASHLDMSHPDSRYRVSQEKLNHDSSHIDRRLQDQRNIGVRYQISDDVPHKKSNHSYKYEESPQIYKDVSNNRKNEEVNLDKGENQPSQISMNDNELYH